MAKSQTTLRVFVASPGDVQDEREELENVVHEIDSLWSGYLGIRLELVRFETHTYPAIGSDPQAVINSQINDDYDVFIGIVWGRFGTPTPRAGSGTEEEFNRAYKRLQGGENVEIMIYFKEEPINPHRLDPEQLKNVLEFKQLISSKGTYYAFKSKNEFSQAAKSHLTRFLQAWSQTAARNTSITNYPDYRASDPPEDIDNISTIDTTETLIFANQRYTLLVEQISESMSSITEEMKNATKNSPTQINELLNRLELRLARRLREFTGRLRLEIPVVREAQTEDAKLAGKLLAKAAAEAAAGNITEELYNRLVASFKNQKEVLERRLNSHIDYRASLNDLGHQTPELRAAKADFLLALDEWGDELLTGARLIRALDELLVSRD